MTPSEWLKSKGWTRMHARPADLSDWRDPETGKDYLFIEAIQIQDARDSVKDDNKCPACSGVGHYLVGDIDEQCSECEGTGGL